VALGRMGEVEAPASATRVNLDGSTVIPAFINGHAQPGYEGSPSNRYTNWRAENWTPDNVLAHLQRAAFYGVGVVVSAGGDEPMRAMQFAQQQNAGSVVPAAAYIYAAGLELPNGGPAAPLMKAGALPKAATVQEARAAVQAVAGRNVRHLNIWITRDGAYPAMTPETYAVYAAVYDEAHKSGLLVHTHASTLADQKAALRGGTDVLVGVTPEAPDEEFLALVRDRKPYWIPVDGPGADPREWCQDPFVLQGLPEHALNVTYNPATGAAALNGCARPQGNAAAGEKRLGETFRAMTGAGARVVLGTNAGMGGYLYGWAEHYTLARFVKFGMTPLQALQTATQQPAELFGLTDRGALAAGKRADFVVLYANPLDNILLTRRIGDVYIGGEMLGRTRLLGAWNRDLQLARNR
jgi:imidazolonepropionase-like amidohydrolase